MPPYFSSSHGQRKPFCPIFSQISLGTIPSFSHCSRFGMTSFARNFLKADLNISCSSLKMLRPIIPFSRIYCLPSYCVPHGGLKKKAQASLTCLVPSCWRATSPASTGTGGKPLRTVPPFEEMIDKRDGTDSHAPPEPRGQVGRSRHVLGAHGHAGLRLAGPDGPDAEVDARDIRHGGIKAAERRSHCLQ